MSGVSKPGDLRFDPSIFATGQERFHPAVTLERCTPVEGKEGSVTWKHISTALASSRAWPTFTAAEAWAEGAADGLEAVRALLDKGGDHALVVERIYELVGKVEAADALTAAAPPP